MNRMDWASLTDEVIMDFENMSRPLQILLRKNFKHVWPRECNPNPIGLLIAEVKRLREENIKLRKLLRKKANKIRAWNKLYKYHNELENNSRHHSGNTFDWLCKTHWEMRELMDTIIKLGEEE